MEKIFYNKVYDRYVSIRSDLASKNNLKEFWRLFDDLDTKQKQKDKFGVHDKYSARRLYRETNRTFVRNPSGDRGLCDTINMCLCNQEDGLECLEVSRLESVNVPQVINGVNRYPSKTPNFPLQFSDYEDLDDTCYFKKDCESSSDKSPYTQCLENYTDTECASNSRKCLYRQTCKQKASKVGYTYDSLPRCNHDLECGSGYCQRIPQRLIDYIDENAGVRLRNGICMPMAICMKKCKRAGEPLITNSDYCCSGLVKTSGNLCGRPGQLLEPVPLFEIDESQADSCTFKIKYSNGSLYNDFCHGAEQHSTKADCEAQYNKITSNNTCSKDGVVDSSISFNNCFGGLWIDDDVRIKFEYYAKTRLIEGLQWFWGDADSDGVNHRFFDAYKIAKHSMLQFFNANTDIENQFFSVMDNFKNELSTSSQTEGSASGVETLRAMANMHSGLMDLSQRRADLYRQLSGVEAFFKFLYQHGVKLYV